MLEKSDHQYRVKYINLCANTGAELQDIQAEPVILRVNAYALRRTWRDIFVIPMKKVQGTKHNIHYVPGGVSSKENNLVIVISMLRNACVPRHHLELATPSALTTQSAVFGVRLRKGKRLENARESMTGIVSVNRPQRKKITRSNDQLTTFANLNHDVT